MKILQINKFLFLKGGAERYFFDLSELLSKKGHRVSAWSTQHPQNFPLPNQKDFIKFNDFSKKEGLKKDFRKARSIFWNREAKQKLEKIIKRGKPDIAHLHNIFSHFSPSIILTLKKYQIPIVLSLHDYKLFCPNYHFFSKNEICFDCLKKNNFRSCLSKKCIKNSLIKSSIGYLEGKWQKEFLKVAEKIDIFLAPSLFMKRRALESGLPNEKVVHLPYLIDNLQNKKFNKNSRGKARYFLYFGRLSQEKGIESLIKAFLKKINISHSFFRRKRAQGKLSQWKLKIVGQGPERKKLEKLVKKQEPIEFLGEKKGKELKKIIARAYLVIVPSVWPENFPFSILESFALAKPVLASRVGGLPELIKDKETGLLFKSGNLDDLAEKIVWAVNHPKEMKQVGKNAQKEILTKCDPENHYKKIIEIYERIKGN